MPNETETHGDVLEHITQANIVVSDLCLGLRRWAMNVPARPDSDPDLVIGHALHESEKEIRRLRAALGEAERERTALTEALDALGIRRCDDDDPATWTLCSREDEGFDTVQEAAKAFNRDITNLGRACDNARDMWQRVEEQRDTALSDLASAREALGKVEQDSKRLDKAERLHLTIKPDGMDGWTVRYLVTSGLRNGYANHGAHRLREAIDAALASAGEGKK